MTENNCEECGQSFGTERGLKIHIGQTHNERYMEASWLEEKHHSEFLTIGEISNLCSVSESTITRWMKRCGVDRREGGRLPYASFYTSQKGYEMWARGSGKTSARVHRLLAISEHGFEEVCRNEIHHKNGIPWDNRPDNIEVLSKSDHASVEYNHPYDSKVGKDFCEDMLDEYNNGATISDIAKKEGLGETTVRTHIRGECSH